MKNVGEKLRVDSFEKHDYYQTLEILLHEDEDFLKIVETLTRIGIPSKKTKTLVQSCHILHRQGRYYLVHFKELFALSNKCHDLVEDDILRRNMIGKLLQQWGLCEIVEPKIIEKVSPFNSIKVVPYKEKPEWELVQKYTMLSDRKKQNEQTQR